MQIPLDSVEAVFHKLFALAKGLQIDTVEVPDDYYWNIDDAALYDLSADQRELVDALNIGSLQHDWERVSALLSEEPDGDGCNSVDFIVLASILRAIGNHLYDSGSGPMVATRTG
jgi:hypothetical protein